jgi:hypothetical protein
MSMLLAVRVFLPFALGYLLASIFRSVSALIATDLAADLGLSPSELGFAVSAFFLSAVVAQVPYGILLDRFDPRRVYAAALILRSQTCVRGGPDYMRRRCGDGGANAEYDLPRARPGTDCTWFLGQRGDLFHDTRHLVSA